ncbi:enolase 4 [Notothenia coriiceps]|uniref:phosphopyruvate hydratase n=1 Tax=Notothenia coriiceps TaxID=8208 RepID=A0A6I9P4L0_9TELE|nr:PREDICTED: enolase-like protein ENO4 [Notothenia coriiceps]
MQPMQENCFECGFLQTADYFKKLCAAPRISRLRGKEVYDARGQLSIEADVFCIVCNKEKSMSSAAVSSLSGPKEALLDQQRAADVRTAAQWINEPLSSMLKGTNPCEQSEVDHILSNFFMARYLEDKDIQNKEKEELGPPSEPEVVPSSPLPAPSKDKKSVDKGKKSTTAEKQLPPAEPPEAVLPGSLAIGSVSLAVAQTGAKIQGVPLYRYIAALKNIKDPAQFHIPVPLITLLSCGKTSTGKLSLLEEVILIPKAGQRVKQIITKTLELQKEMMRIMNTSTKHGAQAVLCDSGVLAVSYERPEQPLDLITEACSNSGLALGTEIQLALNCAASELMDYTKGKYEIATGVLKTPDELVDMYQTLVIKYPAVVALIDPLRREDREQWEKLSNVIGDSCLLLSDITYKAKAPPLPGVRGHILKHTQETTVSDLICITSEHKGSVVMMSVFPVGVPGSVVMMSGFPVGVPGSVVMMSVFPVGVPGSVVMMSVFPVGVPGSVVMMSGFPVGVPGSVVMMSVFPVGDPGSVVMMSVFPVGDPGSVVMMSVFPVGDPGSVVMMMTTCSEPCSADSLSDIAVGLGLDFVKLGGLSGAERMTKYNRLISIEEELSQQGILASKEKHPPPPPLFRERAVLNTDTAHSFGCA